MGKATLLIVTLVSLMGSVYSVNTQRGESSAVGRVAQHQFEALARNAAQAGYQRARQALADSYASTSFSGTYHNGSYSVTITVDGRNATVRSVSTIPNSYGEDVSYTTFATFFRHNGTSTETELPPFMQYAMLANGTLTLKGNFEATVHPSAPGTTNSNVHVNHQLDLSGNSLLVEGYGSYGVSVSASPSTAQFTTFQPNYQPDPLQPTSAPASAVSIPTFSMSDFAAQITPDSVSTGNVTLSGTVTGGTRLDPLVWHITGDLTSSGNTTVDGYVMFIVEGDVSFGGNVTVGSSGYAASDESSIALYASGNVTIHGTVDVYGQIFADQNVSIAGNVKVYGNVVSRGDGTIEMMGNPRLIYRAASPALTTNWQGGEIEMTSYSEWPGDEA